MFRVALAVVMLPMPVLADVVQPPAERHCHADDRVMAAARAGQNGFRRLDQLPAAAEYLTVFRTVDRCPAPLVVRANIGANAPRR